MSNKRITDLTELTTPTTDDVFPVVDIATNTTTKVQLGNLPTTTAVTTALATKQDTLVSGTNIKTVNSTSLLGSGNVAVQETLVSGTNIKTLNSTSLLGSGDIVLTANPSGVAGAIQFSNGSAFASDAANFFWNNTTKRLGVCTNAPSAKVFIQGTEASTTGTHLTVQGTGTAGFSFADYSGTNTYFAMYPSSIAPASRSFSNLILLSNAAGSDVGLNSTAALTLKTGGVNKLGVTSDGINIVDRLTVNSSSVDTSARAVIKGSGSTSATTSLLVQNSGGTEMLKVDDGRNAYIVNQTSSAVYLGNTTGYGGMTINGNSGTILSTAYATHSFNVFNGSTYETALQVKGQGAASQVSIGTTTPTASAKLQADSTTQGFLPPRMTTTQKNAIATPAAGLVVYDTTTNKLCCYNGSTWNDLF